jgi:hypothetical protein
LIEKKVNATYRKNETEDMRRYINDIKATIKDETSNLAHVQAEMTEKRTRLEKTTIAAEIGELKVEIKLLELNETELKARITEENALLTEE